MPKWCVIVIESREFRVAYDVEADTLEEALAEDLADSELATEDTKQRLDDSTTQLFIDRVFEVDDDGVLVGQGLVDLPPHLKQAHYQAEQQFANEAIRKAKLVAAEAQVRATLSAIVRAFGDSSLAGTLPPSLVQTWQAATELAESLE